MGKDTTIKKTGDGTAHERDPGPQLTAGGLPLVNALPLPLAGAKPPSLDQRAGPHAETPNTKSDTSADALSAEPSSDGAMARRAAKRRPAGPSRRVVAANDDIPTIGALIYALEQKPSKQPFKMAAYATIGWAILGLFFGWAMLAPELAKSAGLWEVLARPTLMIISATVLLPIALFWFFATLVWRAQELKLMSSAMTEVAVRLAEPDRSAEQSVASLGQTVRKQVNFMNEAVTRAIGRAGELEAMVHSEVTNLERSFQDNETRIRGVLAELARERTQLVSTSTEVHTTLRAMGDEVPALIEKLNGQQGKLARIIESAGQNLIALEGSLVKASDKLEGSLGDRTGHLQKVLEEYTGALNDTLGNRTAQMQVVFEEYTRALDATMAQRSETMSDTLIERTRALDDAFAERLQLVDQSIVNSTSTIDSVIGERAVALSAAMETHARQLAVTLGQQSQDIDETLMHGIDAVRRSSENITRQSVKAIEGLSGQADMLRNVSENLLTQIGGVTNRFETQGQSIMRAANALETANFRIDSTLQTRHRELNDTLQKLSGKAGELDEVMRGYSTNLEGSMSEAEARARSLTQELSRGAEAHARTTLADLERMRAETEAQASRTLQDMQSQFSTVGREMSTQMGSLSSRLSETSEDLRLKTQRATADLMAEQERLRAEAERIPNATRESTDAMRRVLNEQIRALDQLSALTNREAIRRDVMPPAPLQGGPGTGGRMPASLSPPKSLTATWTEQQARAPQQAAGAGHPVGQNGWSLGDLLSRASGSGDPRAAAPVAPINLEVIASALDADTAAAIWSRYRAGQRGIMVRSIYTADGRNTYDEVTRRYGSEPAFQATVNRFLADFERLLRESEARDASGRAVEGHLTSPSGRTYLFLAHAAGRLN